VPSPPTLEPVSPSPLPAGVLASIPVDLGTAPQAANAAFGSIWIVEHRGNTLYRVDPKTNAVVAKIDLGAAICFPPQFGFGRVFLIACEGGSGNLVVDPSVNRVVAKSQCGAWMAFGGGSIWDGESRSVRVCDPKTYRTTAVIKLPGGFSGMAYGFGSVWAVNEEQGTVLRIDPSTHRVTATIVAGDGCYSCDEDSNILLAFGHAWVESDSGNTIYRIDPATNAVRIFHDGAKSLGDFDARWLVAGLGSLWLTTSVHHISRFDPKTMRVIGTYPADPTAGGSDYIGVAYGSLWVPNAESDDVWRDRIRS
jgi:streptogramin lyase